MRNHFRPSLVLIFGIAALLSCVVHAQDWPQWRGPSRDGVTKEKLTIARWPAEGAAPIAWRIQIGKGHTNISTQGNRGFTAGWDGKEDVIRCIDLDSGQTIWKQSYKCDTIVQWPGPRASVTVDGDTVYMLGQHGQLHALDAKTGDIRWKKQMSVKAKPDDDYGYVWSPLVVGDLLILPVGKGGLALNKRDGAVVWGDDQSRGACASAVPFTQGGTACVAMILTRDDRESSFLIGVEVRTGKVLWQHNKWPEKWGAVCVDLVTDGSAFFVTSSEQYKQCARLSIAGATLKQDWSHNKFACYTGGAVLLGDHLFGIDTKRGGQLKCIDWKTGSEQWAQHDFGTHGALIAADGKLLVQTSESGELVIIESSTKEYRELRRMKVFEGRANTFTPPVYSGGRIYCRSYEDELVSVMVE